MKHAPRICAVCGKPGPAEGPLPYEWDSHLVAVGVRGGRTWTAMEMSCSAKCRAAKGWPNRKAVG